MDGQADIRDAVQRIREAVSPGRVARIVLFGSAARGDASPGSDLDFLVVVEDGTHRRKMAMRIYDHFHGYGRPKDIVVVTESDLAAHADNPGLIIKSALREGRVVYAA